MQTIKFLSRVAFICNICFLLTLVLIWINHPPEGAIVSLIIILGYFLAFLFNGMANLCYGFLLIIRRFRLREIPFWLIIVNFLFLILQLILFLR
jgi:hypothetical protein